MRAIFYLFLLSTIPGITLAQTGVAKQQINSNLSLGGYAQIDYNQKIDPDEINYGTLDVHRFVGVVNYKFNDRTSFVGEVEIEHVVEVTAEQAYLQYRIDNKGLLNFKAGLLLIPMGIINEYHEPTTFNGVERPNVDNKIVPTTWREIGAGFSGKSDAASIKYQLYLVNGFKSYAEEEGLLRGSDGLRKGRQKGAESIIHSPNFSAKVDFYRINGLNIGISGYTGNTQSTRFASVSTNNAQERASADSSIVGVNMVGLDARYNWKGFQWKGQFVLANISNTLQYNALTSKDLGSELMGYYAEIGYDLLALRKKESDLKLVAFTRYEMYDTHHKVEGITKNTAYNANEIIAGLNFFTSPGSVFKADFRRIESGSGVKTNMVNLGVGVFF